MISIEILYKLWDQWLKINIYFPEFSLFLKRLRVLPKSYPKKWKKKEKEMKNISRGMRRENDLGFDAKNSINQLKQNLKVSQKIISLSLKDLSRLDKWLVVWKVLEICLNIIIITVISFRNHCLASVRFEYRIGLIFMFSRQSTKQTNGLTKIIILAEDLFVWHKRYLIDGQPLTPKTQKTPKRQSIFPICLLTAIIV